MPMPDFIAPQLCQSVSRPPTGPAGCTKSNLTAIAFSCGSKRQGEPEDPQGPRLDSQIPGDRRRGRLAADWIIDGEIVALDENGAPDFAALQAALSEQNTDDLVSTFRSPIRRAANLRRWSRCRTKGTVAELLPGKRRKPADPLCGTFRDGRRRRAAFGVQALARGHRLEAADAPYRSGRTDSWTKAKCRAGHEVVIGGWSTTRQRSARCWSGCIGAIISSMSAASAPASAKTGQRNCCHG